MSFRRLVLPAAFALLLVAFAGATRAADKPAAAATPATTPPPAAAAPATPGPAAAMQEWQRLSAPGKGHEALGKFAGAWDAKTKMWLGGPGSTPAEDTGLATFRMVLGGRYLQQDYSGQMTMTDATGKPQQVLFQGIGFMGYDNFRNLYTSTWNDNMSTVTLTMSGSASPDGQTIRMFGQMDDPALKSVGRTYQTVMRWVDADHFVFEMYDMLTGPDAKVMEITYSRKKA